LLSVLFTKQLAVEDSTSNSNNLQHPVIIGTNELGQVVKRYKIEAEYKTHYLYQVGDTKTVNIERAKHGVETFAVEQKP
jgi:hypothetical protein